MAELLDNRGYVESRTLARLAALTQSLKRRTRELLEVRPGGRVVDVGCGPGTDTITLAHLVGPKGFVAGVDNDEGMIREADDKARSAKVTPWTSHVVADARAIPFETAAFDASLSERLLQHLPHADPAFAEMVRITRPGGRVAVADADWCSLSIDTPEKTIERQVCRALPDLQANGYAARELFRLFGKHGIVRLTVEAHPIVWTDYATFRRTSLALQDLDQRIVASGAVSGTEWQRFLESLEESGRRGRFFASANMLLVVGTTPLHRNDDTCCEGRPDSWERTAGWLEAEPLTGI